ncbi:hypothetical protein B6C83_02040 [Aerococcus urinae]|uniref:Class A sortase n=2 Tax=Aerococcus urinae TaxID=1376 RepID=A0A329NHD9_9LACT|nr:class A sortase [Aerococcus urinae]ORE70885.1 hypothetical protein B6C83_02040 [Aerococcus urinae]QPS02014.1 class A sortase [Aerococcus urinae]RAV67721.1 class A sortase [Aerococcus urinae]
MKNKGVIMKKINWSRILGILLILVGIGFIIYQYVPAVQVYINQKTYALSNVDRDQVLKNQEDNSGNYDPNQVTMVTPEMVRAARKRIREGSDELNVIGALAMPKQNISISVMNGLSESVLLSGAGTFYPNQEMGVNNYPLASHNMDAIAPGLLLSPMVENTSLGDKIYLTDMKNIYEYETFYAQKTDPSRVDMVTLESKEPIVTLVTCEESTSAAMRYIVQGKLVKQWPFEKAPKEVIEYFS